MKRVLILIFITTLFLLTSCGDDNGINPVVEDFEPSGFSFYLDDEIMFSFNNGMVLEDVSEKLYLEYTRGERTYNVIFLDSLGNEIGTPPSFDEYLMLMDIPKPINAENKKAVCSTIIWDASFTPIDDGETTFRLTLLKQQDTIFNSGYLPLEVY